MRTLAEYTPTLLQSRRQFAQHPSDRMNQESHVLSREHKTH